MSSTDTCSQQQQQHSRKHQASANSSAVMKLASAMLSEKLAVMLDQLSRQSVDLMTYCICCLIFVAAAARHPELLPANRRIETFLPQRSANKELRCDKDRDEELQQAASWSDAGFYLQASGKHRNEEAVCFHCGFRCKQNPGASDPLKRHHDGSPACQLARLLQAARTGAVPAEDAAKLRRACAKLYDDLFVGAAGQQLLARAASYGFDRRQLAFVASRDFMRGRDGSQLDGKRPGDLIELVHQSEALLDCLQAAEALIDIEQALGQARQPQEAMQAASETPARRSQAGSPQPPRPQAAAEPAENCSAKPTGEGKSDSAESPADDRCVACQSARRSHVTLPCAHFLLCSGCLSNRSICPKCGSGILAGLRAFIA